MMIRNNRRYSYAGDAGTPGADPVPERYREEETLIPDGGVYDDVDLNSLERSTFDVITGHGRGSFLRYGT